MTPTKLAIKKLLSAPAVTVKLMNGCYKEASVSIDNNGLRWEMRYELSHPMLQQFVSRKDKCELICWKGSSGVVYKDIPPELEQFRLKLKEAATMTDYEAADAYEYMLSIIMEFNSQMFGDIY